MDLTSYGRHFSSLKTKDVSELIAEAKKKNISHLKLENFSFQPLFEFKLVLFFERFEKINLRGCTINFDQLFELLGTEGTNLESLDLSYTNLTEADLTKLAKACPNLKLLRVVGCSGVNTFDINSIKKSGFNKLEKLHALL